MPTDLDIWIDSVGRKKGRIFGLGSISKTLIPSSNQQTNTHANSDEASACFKCIMAKTRTRKVADEATNATSRKRDDQY